MSEVSVYAFILLIIYFSFIDPKARLAQWPSLQQLLCHLLKVIVIIITKVTSPHMG